jgi:hypothetical protein
MELYNQWMSNVWYGYYFITKSVLNLRQEKWLLSYFCDFWFTWPGTSHVIYFCLKLKFHSSDGKGNLLKAELFPSKIQMLES